MAKSYKWTKVWAVQTDSENPISVGDTVMVESSRGTSKNEVLSITIMTGRNGRDYKVLLCKSL